MDCYGGLGKDSDLQVCTSDGRTDCYEVGRGILPLLFCQSFYEYRLLGRLCYCFFPFGPWKKHPNSPIIHRSLVGENGSGHGDVFKGLDGKYYYVYHVHRSDSTVSPRKTRIVPLILKKGNDGIISP